jgi:hypothetical protein
MPRKKQPAPTEDYYRSLGYTTVKVRLLGDAAEALVALVESGLSKTEAISEALIALARSRRLTKPAARSK